MVIEKTIVTNLASLEDVNPYYMHHGDHLDLLIVSQPLTGDNYITKSHVFHKALSVKKKSGFINGSIVKPTSVIDLLHQA